MVGISAPIADVYHKEQANAIFTSILHTEVTPPSPHRPASPTRPPPITSNSTTAPPSTPTRRRLFAYNSPSASNPATPTRRLDTPIDEAYSMSPVRAESRQLLESPRRQLRSVCKTPYRVLDAPELADDFYLNLVDWSSTNVLGVGLGSCVYLWTAHNAAVSKLCDLADTNDTISSVSWVQKVRFRGLTYPILLVNPNYLGHNPCRRNTRRETTHIRRQHSHTPTHLPTSTHPTHRCPRLERPRPFLRLTRPHGAPPRRPRTDLPPIQTVYGSSAGSVRAKMEWGRGTRSSEPCQRR